MRAAKYADYWRHVAELTPAHSAITQVNISGSNFNLSCFQVISGQNGSGKSSLLRHLAGFHPANRQIQEKINFTAQESTIVDATESKFQYTSPSWLVEENRRRIKELQEVGQFDEYVQGLESYEFTKSLLGFVNYVICTSFTAINITELEKPQTYQPGKHIPEERERAGENGFLSENETAYDRDDFLEGKSLYITVSTGATAPAFTDLSQGEQYVILFIYLINSRKGRAILVDEPETYLSPLSQYHLADVLARFSVENKLQFILATHSICFIEKAQVDKTLMIGGAHTGELFMSGGKRVTSYLRGLGYKVPKENIALFEDVNAQRFFANIVRNFDADWLASLELIALTGESDISAILGRIKNYRILAIFDADQNGKIDPNKYPSHHVVFLPGQLAPEQELINSVKANPEEFSRRSGIPDIQERMRLIEGVDHHDYFVQLGEVTQCDPMRLFDDAFWVWSSNNSERIERFLKELMG